MSVDPSHAFGPWAPLPSWPARETRTCAACGGVEEREPTLQGYHGHSEKLERVCGTPEPREGILAPPGVLMLGGGYPDPHRRYSYFEMRYPMRQTDGSVAIETIQFPCMEAEWNPVATDPTYTSDLGRTARHPGVGKQFAE